MFDETPQGSDVAWLHNLVLASTLHSVMISTIVSCKQGRAQSMGVNEPFDTSTLSK
jgi:hypothetical protein